jgi:hypothetical protein
VTAHFRHKQIILFLCVAEALFGSWALALRAGAAKNTITPDVHVGKVYLAGFGFNRVATGVHDNLYARCVAIEAGQKTLVICAADLIGFFHQDVLKVRAKVKAQLPRVTQVIVASTHDHEGPDMLGLWGPKPLSSGANLNYLNWVIGRIAATAVESVKNLQPAQITLARNHSPLLELLQDDSRPPYVKDPYLFLMRFTSPAGGPIATLINWSDHPETLGGENTLITADYPYWLCRSVEQHEGGTAIFVNGSIGGLLSTLGNQVSLLDPDTGQVAADGTWEKAKLAGNTVGEVAVLTLRRDGRTVRVDSMVIRKTMIYIPLSNKLFRLDDGMGVLGYPRPVYTDGKLDMTMVNKPVSFVESLINSYGGGHPRAEAGVRRELRGVKTFKYATGRDLRSEVDYIQFRDQGRVIAEIMTVPGEIYPELVNGGITRYPGADFPEAPFEPILRPHLKSRYQFIFGLANDEIGYIIPKAEWDNKPPWLLNRPHRWYGEINSVGLDGAGVVTQALVKLIEDTGQ